MPLMKQTREFSNLFTTGHSSETYESQEDKRVDWHKLASVDLSDLTAVNSDGVSSPATLSLQDHLTYIASCDAATELDMAKLADRRTLLKLFRISQLLLQQFVASNRVQQSQLKKLQEDLATCTEKYYQTKSKLLQQITEAKKMKNNNHNLRDTVKYINSVAISKGILQPLKCNFCSKMFREQEFLTSHMERKHSFNVQSVKNTKSMNLNHINLLEGFQSPNVNNNDSVTLNGNEPPDRELSVRNKQFQELIQKNISQEEKFIPKGAARNSNWTDTSGPQTQAACQVLPSFDTKRVADVESRCDAMNDKIIEIMTDFRKQKTEWEKEHLKNREEVEKVQQEKIILERNFRMQLETMQSKLQEWENRSKEEERANMEAALHDEKRLRDNYYSKSNFTDEEGNHLSIDECQPYVENNEFFDLSTVNQRQISHIQAQMIANKLSNKRPQKDTQEEFSKDSRIINEEAILSSITEVSVEKDSDSIHEDSIYDIKSLPSDNEKLVSGPKVKKTNTIISPINKSGTTIQTSEYIRDSSASRKHVMDRASESVQDIASKVTPSPKIRTIIPVLPDKSTKPTAYTATPRVVQEHATRKDMYGSVDSESDDTNSWVKERNDLNDGKIERNEHAGSSCDGLVADRLASDGETKSEDEDQIAGDDIIQDSDDSDDENHSLGSTNLEELLNRNPALWEQLKLATIDVVNTRLQALEITFGEGGISKASYKTAIRELTRNRTEKSKKHSNFKKLRKNLHHKVKTVINQMESQRVNNIPISQPIGNKKTFNMFRKAGKTVKRHLNKNSEYFHKVKKISSKPEKLEASTTPASAIEPAVNIVTCVDTTEQDDSDISEETKHELDTVIDIHSGTPRQSVRRNLLVEAGSRRPSIGQLKQDEPKVTYTQLQDEPRELQGEVNMAYSEESFEESGTESADEEDVAVIERPPTRIDRLFNADYSEEDSDTNVQEGMKDESDVQYLYEPEEYKPIKLKKPTGENIIKLKNRIESQLQQRQKKKLAGAVNTVAQPAADLQQSDVSGDANSAVYNTQVTRFTAVSSDTEDDQQ